MGRRFLEGDGRLIDAFVTGFRSAKTRSNYRANLSAWLRWTAEIGVNGFAVERCHVEAYVGHLEQVGYAPNTICQRIATLSSFYRWALIEGHLPGNPVEGARRPRKPTESAANGLSRHELTDWLDAAERRGGSAYACACLLALNGLRVGELCATSVEDLGESTWHHTLTLRASTTKGHKAAVVALAPRSVQAVTLAVGGRRSGPLLINRHERRMTPYNVAYLVDVLCREVGWGGGSRRTASGTRRSPSLWTPGSGYVTCRTSPVTKTPKPPRGYDRSRTTSTATPPTPSPNTSPAATDICCLPAMAISSDIQRGRGTDDRPAHPRRT